MRFLARVVASMGAIAAVTGLLASGAAGASPPAHAPRLCSLQSSLPFQLNPRPSANADPLSGARFFLDGPGTNRGFAATAIAQLLGRDPNRFGHVTWTKFANAQSFRGLSPGDLRKVQLLGKIAAQPEVKRFSIYSAGGGPGAVYSQVQKLLCRMQQTDPGACESWCLISPDESAGYEYECSFVLGGRVGALLGEEVVYGKPGDLIFKQRDQWHTLWNAGDQPARILEMISPGRLRTLFLKR